MYWRCHFGNIICYICHNKNLCIKSSDRVAFQWCIYCSGSVIYYTCTLDSKPIYILYIYISLELQYMYVYIIYTYACMHVYINTQHSIVYVVYAQAVSAAQSSECWIFCLARIYSIYNKHRVYSSRRTNKRIGKKTTITTTTATTSVVQCLAHINIITNECDIAKVYIIILHIHICMYYMLYEATRNAFTNPYYHIYIYTNTTA